MKKNKIDRKRTSLVFKSFSNIQMQYCGELPQKCCLISLHASKYRTFSEIFILGQSRTVKILNLLVTNSVTNRFSVTNSKNLSRLIHEQQMVTKSIIPIRILKGMSRKVKIYHEQQMVTKSKNLSRTAFTKSKRVTNSSRTAPSRDYPSMKISENLFHIILCK